MGSPLDSLLPGNRILSVNGVRPAQGRDRVDFLATGASIADDPSRQRTVITLPGSGIGPTPWVTFTPTFSASGGGFTLGNGVAVGAWRQESEDTLEVSAALSIGTTTNFGAGSLLLATFPVNSIATKIDVTKLAAGIVIPFWCGRLSDADATTSNKECRVDFFDDTHFSFMPEGSAVLVSGTVPWTWATGDELRIGVKFPFVFVGA